MRGGGKRFIITSDLPLVASLLVSGFEIVAISYAGYADDFKLITYTLM